MEVVRPRVGRPAQTAYTGRSETSMSDRVANIRMFFDIYRHPVDMIWIYLFPLVYLIH